MAVLQKIRNRGVLLVAAIAVALFLFVIGDAIRGSESFFMQSKQEIGEIDGESVDYQEYQQLINDLQVYYEVAQNRSSLNEDEMNSLKDEAWQTLIQNRLVAAECEKLGITVTDEEVAEIIRSGQHQLLQVPFFMNQQTGRYDYTQVQTFLSEYKKMKEAGSQVPEVYEKLYKFYIFAQKSIREQALMGKYQTLLSNSFLSNKVEAQMAFDARNNESDIILASLPFSKAEVKDDAVTDDDIKAKYNADKEKYIMPMESRDIKMVSVTITASKEDEAKHNVDMENNYVKLNEATTNAAAGNVVQQSTSLLQYSDVYKSKDAFRNTPMIYALLDSIETGNVSRPQYDAATNTYYTVKLLGKTTQADSILYRQIGVVAKDEAGIAKTADSIMTALSSGAKFKDIAKKYNQEGDSAWVSTAGYEQGVLDADNALFINTLFNMAAGETKKVTLSNGNTIILQVLDTKNPITKYNVAAVVKEKKFFDETYNNEYNKFSSFVAANTTIEDIEKNAVKSGYAVTPFENVTPSSHNIAGIHNTSDAVKWLFQEAEVGSVSQLYECGDNDHLLIIALTGINKAGYASVDKVKEQIKEELLNEKRAEKLLANLKGINSIAAAQKKGALVDSVSHVSFANPAAVRSTGSSEPMVSAIASKTAKGAVSAPFKGNAAVYVLQVTNKSKTAEKFDAKAEKETAAYSNFRAAAGNIMQTLFLKANIKDERYKFF